MSKGAAWLIVGFWILLVVFAYGIFLGRDEGVKAMKVEVVQRGYATWVINENGNTHFEWKEPTP